MGQANRNLIVLVALPLLWCAEQVWAKGPLQLDDPPQPFVPRQPRNEADEDRVRALALFAAGHVAEQREEYHKALRLYQRALFWDPQATTVAAELVPLALRQKHYAAAVRYVLKTGDTAAADPLVLRGLGAYLVKQGDFAKAAALYERALAARTSQKETAAEIRLRTEMQMEMGRICHLAEQYPKAADCFARVVYALEHPAEFHLDDEMKKQLLDEPGPTWLLFGDCFLSAGRLPEATAAFEKAHAAVPNQTLREFNLARVAARAGKPAEALAKLQTCFDARLAGEGTAPYELLAEVLKKLGKEGELIARLEKLHAAAPGDPALADFLAEQYQRAGRLDKAEGLFLAVIKKQPTLTAYRALLEIFRKSGRIEPLLSVAGQAVEKSGMLETLGPEGKAIAGDAALMGRLVETARKQLKQSPEKLDYGMRLAVALLAMEAKQYETAGEFFEAARAVRHESAAEILFTWGLGLVLAERPAEAVKVFQRGIAEKLLPADNPTFDFYLAGALEIAGRTDEALAAARKATGAKKTSARFCNRVAWVLYHGKRYDEALPAYREFVERFDADHESAETRDLVHDARLALSNLCVLKNRLPDAEEWLLQVLDEFPGDVSAGNDLGYLWADQGKHLQRALGMVEAAVKAEPENAAYRDSLGWVYFRLGRSAEAVAELEKSAARQPDAVVLEHLGDAYRKAGRPAEARDAWRRAAAAYRKEKEEEKARRLEGRIVEASQDK